MVRIYDRFEKYSDLGNGGNGKVYEVLDEKRNLKCALKILKNKKGSYYWKKVQRFSDEVKTVVKWQDSIQGILPIIDYNIEKPYWYTMELATPIEVYLSKIKDNERINEVVKIIISLSKSLVELHSNNIVHRDIKPNNIYYFKDRYCFGDFGLVDFPSKKDITQMKESVGPRDTIAPEMKRNAFSADGKPADVYSLAKTFWILLTKEDSCFDGQYIADDKTIGLSSYLKNEHLIELNYLLEKCTDNTPDNRPTIDQFLALLIEWWDIRNDDVKAGISQWKHIQKRLFGQSIPSKMEWEDTSEILKTLQIISDYNQINHMFMPDGGGLDLDEVFKAGEQGCIGIIGNDIISIIKPKILCYESIERDPLWSYFRLDFDILEPVFEEESKCFEEITEVTAGKYDEWEHGRYGYDENDIPLPEGYRTVTRYLYGSIVIFSKLSIYNHISGTYDGRHNKIESQEFKKYIINMRKNYLFASEKEVIDNFYDKYNKNPFKEDVQSNRLKIYEEKIERENKAIKIIETNIEYIGFAKEYNEIKQISPQQTCTVFNLSVSLEKEHASGQPKIRYVLDENYYFIKVSLDLLSLIRSIDCGIQNPLKFDNFEQVEEMKKVIIKKYKEKIEEIGIEVDLENILSFIVNSIRIKKPEHIFTREEIENALRNGNDHINNTLVIDFNGYAHLVSSNDTDMSQFAVIHEGYCAYNNYVGKYSELNHLDDAYIGLLEGWEDHLEHGTQSYIDYIEYKFNEEELIEKIKALMK